MDSYRVATIGFFDGVHRGHQFLINNVIEEAKRSDMQSLVITFDQHPRQVLQQDFQPRLLTTFGDKLRLINMTGVDKVAVMHFNSTLASFSAEEFMDIELKQHLNVKKLIIGYDNRFGHNREEGFDDYVRYGKKLGIEVIHAKPFTLDGIKVSSSLIRQFLNGGEIEMANKCLGHPFTLRGTVAEGFHIGHTIGFPTANLDTGDSGLLVPPDGVYAVETQIDEKGRWMHGMMYIGNRPTFHGSGRTIETFIFDFHKDIYGQPMAVRVLKRMRGQMVFENGEQLAEQLKKDRKNVEDFF